MSPLAYVKPERIFLKDRPDYNEIWVQDRIAEDPGILGLGELILKDRERIHPGAGRLDLLCQSVDTNRRFEIELQLGRTDESHIIRTIEYWDIERKRYPQYDHTAVIVAEDITSRFLNVVGLFNGFIPIVAIQLKALKIGDQISLDFTTVLSEMRLGLVDEDEEVREVTDRAYWESRASKTSLEIADALYEYVKEIDPGLALKYNKFYIGLAKNGRASNFVSFNPKKDWVQLNAKVVVSEHVHTRLGESGLDLMEYDTRRNSYRIRVSREDVTKHAQLLKDLFQMAYKEYSE